MVVVWVVLLGIWKISTVEITNAIVNKTPNNYFFIEVFLSLITAMTATRPIKAGNPKANKFKRLNWIVWSKKPLAWYGVPPNVAMTPVNTASPLDVFKTSKKIVARTKSQNEKIKTGK